MIDKSKLKLVFDISTINTSHGKRTSKQLVTRTCQYCGKVFEIPAYYGVGNYCSKVCADNARKKVRVPNCKCDVCGKMFFIQPSRLKRSKYHTCSRECSNELRKTIYLGVNNPNYGNRAKRCKMVNNGHLYYKVHLDSHPFGRKTNATIGVYYPEHRYVVEQNYSRFDEKYFIIIDGKHYLKPDVDVHHLNEDTTDNNIDNLVPLTRSEHTRLHNLQKEIIHDELGRITGVVKHSELLESHGNDNQQPSIDSNIDEGSTTSSRIQPDNAEDGNAAKSAVPSSNTSEDIV